MKYLLTVITLFVMVTSTAGETDVDKTTPESKTESTSAETTQIKTTTVKPRAEPKINTALVLGMNVRGNKESPLSLTIVPWRSADHSTKDPKISASWQPELSLLQPEAYRRNINAFLKSRQSRVSGTKNENQ